MANIRITKEIDYDDIYTWFNGSIWEFLDCGAHICGNGRCCFPHKTHSGLSYIYFLPREREFLQKKLASKFPYTVVLGETQLHCPNNYHCVYEYRCIDCRSYPYWPLVKNNNFIGLIDYRNNRCPIAMLPDEFRLSIMNNWSRLFKEYSEIINWIEKTFAPEGDIHFL